MEDIKDYLSVQKCNCGRSDCQFFGAGEEYGRSFTRESLETSINDMEEVIKHFKDLLSTPQE